MPNPINIPQYIEFGKICEFLAADDENNYVKNPGGTIMPYLSRLLNFVRTAIECHIEAEPDDETLADALFYWKSLFGKYWQQALTVTGGGTGVIITPGTSANYAWIREQTTVGGGTLSDGDTVWVLNYEGVIYNSVNVELNDVVLPRNVVDEISYVVTIQATTFTITFNQALVTTQKVVVTAVQLV